MLLQKIIVGILISISIVGVIGLPMGDPKLIGNAIGLELSFVALALVSAWKLRLALIPNMIIAIIVIIGNTASPRHMEIMTSFVPFDNAMILIIGGYILQALLLIFSAIAFKNRKQLQIQSK